jgi:hypothetical protein
MPPEKQADPRKPEQEPQIGRQGLAGQKNTSHSDPYLSIPRPRDRRLIRTIRINRRVDGPAPMAPTGDPLIIFQGLTS